MKSIILGYKGEVGGALYEVLSKIHQVYGVEADGQVDRSCTADTSTLEPEDIDLMHVCLRHSHDFLDIVRGYIVRFQPRIVDICTTVPPGTTEKLGPNAVHSTTRGVHPHLARGLQLIPKHISGLQAEAVAHYYRKAGLVCVTNPNPRTTETLHLLNNLHYGVNLLFADLAYRACRRHGVDYIDYMTYTQTNNAGYTALGHESKVRPVLTPPRGRIGGHCVVMSAQMLADGMREPLIDLVAMYNDS